MYGEEGAQILSVCLKKVMADCITSDWLYFTHIQLNSSVGLPLLQCKVNSVGITHWSLVAPGQCGRKCALSQVKVALPGADFGYFLQGDTGACPCDLLHVVLMPTTNC